MSQNISQDISQDMSASRAGCEKVSGYVLTGCGREHYIRPCDGNTRPQDVFILATSVLLCCLENCFDCSVHNPA